MAKGPKKNRTTKEPPGSGVDALAELAPFSKALAELATRPEPENADAPPEVVEAAYVLRATWLALHRAATDRAAADELHEVAKWAIGYLEKNPRRGVESTVCDFFRLPPVKGVNRANRLRRLIFVAEHALKLEQEATAIVGLMLIGVSETFPHLLPAPFGLLRDQRPAVTEKITSAIDADHRRMKLTPPKLVKLTLRALGMPDTEIANVMRSAGE